MFLFQRSAPVYTAPKMAKVARQTLWHEGIMVGITVTVAVLVAYTTEGSPALAIAVPVIFAIPGLFLVIARRFQRPLWAPAAPEPGSPVAEAVISAAIALGLDPSSIRVAVEERREGIWLPGPVQILWYRDGPVVLVRAETAELPTPELTALLTHELGHIQAGHLTLRHRVIDVIANRFAVPLGFGLFLSSTTSDGWALAAVGYLLLVVLHQFLLLRSRVEGRHIGKVDPNGDIVLPSATFLAMLVTGLGVWYLPMIFVSWGGVPWHIAVWSLVVYGVLRTLWLALSQRREALIDAMTAETGLGVELADALVRLERGKDTLVSRVFGTHPPVALRVRRLRRAAA